MSDPTSGWMRNDSTDNGGNGLLCPCGYWLIIPSLSKNTADFIQSNNLAGNLPIIKNKKGLFLTVSQLYQSGDKKVAFYEVIADFEE